MIREPIFDWDKETGIASCILTDGEREYYGEAICHDDDLDMMNEKTGCEIAFRRASIKALREKKRDLKLQLSALNQLYYSMKHSKNFNPKSYENKMLQRQIQMINFDLTTIKEILAGEEQRLIEYIKEKDKFYQHIRRNRAKSQR
jgi:hypothetical protein